jgi:hypothetical protein
MSYTMKTSDVIDRLAGLANGDMALVDEAIRVCAGQAGGKADLKLVVDYIVTRREAAVA